MAAGPEHYETIRLTDGSNFYKTITTDTRTLMEYSAGKLIYSGTNSQSVSVGDATWVIKKLFYTGNDLVDVQVLTGSWSGRAALSWKSQGGD
jgi:hypothetical protein